MEQWLLKVLGCIRKFKSMENLNKEYNMKKGALLEGKVYCPKCKTQCEFIWARFENRGSGLGPERGVWLCGCRK